MKIKKLFAIILLLTSFHVYSFNELKIEKILYKGLQRINKNEILSKIPINIKNITKRNIKFAINYLFSTGYFENVKATLNKKCLIFYLKERPIIEKINLIGNLKIKNDILIKNIKNQGIKEGKFLNKNLLFHIKKNIKDFYYNKGKFNISVKINIKYFSKNRVILNFKINEGKYFKIKKINIIGNKKFSHKTLISLLHLHDKISWWNFFKNRKYDKIILMKDLKDIYNFYYRQGYANFNINSIKINLEKNKKYIYITLYLTEGSQYKISYVDFKCNINKKINKIKKIINKIKIGKLYDGIFLLKIKNDIKNILLQNGYIFSKIDIKSNLDEKNKKIKLLFNIFYGNRYYVRYIIFSGNFINKDIVLRRQLIQMEQNIINMDFIKKGKENLNNLNFFEKVNFNIIPVFNKKNQVDVLYNVKEINTGNINAGLGFSSKNGINFQININQYNWLGTGNSFSFHSTKNSFQDTTILNIKNPYITYKGIGLNTKFFYDDISSSNENMLDYNIHSYGSEMILNFPLKKKHFLGIGLNYTHKKINNIKQQISICRYLESFNIYSYKRNDNLKINANDFLFNLQCKINTLNDFYFPKYGTYFKFSGIVTLPGSYNKYYKIYSKYKYYFPLNKNKNWIFITRLQLGYLSGINKKEPPFFENFFSNNKNIIRGFSNNTIGPKAIYYKYNKYNMKYNKSILKESNISIGGNVIGIANFELVIPLFLNYKNNYKLIRSLFFIDIGTIIDSNWENNNITKKFNILDYGDFKKIRMSYGISFQWISPIGPLSFSYAQPIKKYKKDIIEKFQFNIGKIW
ncbi:outer membrane protein assembly factor BamA [Sodalis-like secondary symbiont of Drepanosiphum platanoidis]|uniref:outer membrane protein assembly factor BamA n=1 Tax=Sodalis-like secondary symbiont of Drepanosiphum platanoidis TaxID=2994493 RepID=UPI003464873D